MLDYISLSTVAAIAREGSFERAAQSLGVTRSAVSQRVRAIEETLGTALILRGQPCTATPAGLLLCAHVERVRLLEGEISGALAGTTQPGPPTLRIAINADSLATWVMPALAAFTASGTALVDIVLDNEDRTADRLRAGDVLAAITADAAPVQGCKTIALGALTYAAVASPAFMRKHFGGGVTSAALQTAPALRFNHADLLQMRWIAAHGAARVTPGPANWIPSAQGFVDAALCGMGWGMNPLTAIADHLEAGRLVELLPGRHVDVKLHWQHARIGTTLLAALTQQIRLAARRGLTKNRL
jgi:LysR family transcriptional regulator (chromosome initiation inhibitor)